MEFYSKKEALRSSNSVHRFCSWAPREMKWCQDIRVGTESWGEALVSCLPLSPTPLPVWRLWFGAHSSKNPSGAFLLLISTPTPLFKTWEINYTKGFKQKYLMNFCKYIYLQNDHLHQGKEHLQSRKFSMTPLQPASPLSAFHHQGVVSTGAIHRNGSVQSAACWAFLSLRTMITRITDLVSLSHLSLSEIWWTLLLRGIPLHETNVPINRHLGCFKFSF